MEIRVCCEPRKGMVQTMMGFDINSVEFLVVTNLFYFVKYS